MIEFEKGLVVAIGHHFCGAGSGPEIDALGQSMAEEIAKDAAAYVRAYLASDAVVERAAKAIVGHFAPASSHDDEPAPVICTAGQWRKWSKKRARAALAAVME